MVKQGVRDEVYTQCSSELPTETREERLALGKEINRRVTAKIAEMWRGLSEADRVPYEKQAREAQEKYQLEMAEFEAAKRGAAEVRRIKVGHSAAFTLSIHVFMHSLSLQVVVEYDGTAFNGWQVDGNPDDNPHGLTDPSQCVTLFCRPRKKVNLVQSNKSLNTHSTRRQGNAPSGFRVPRGPTKESTQRVK